jgi:hypothetical protein
VQVTVHLERGKADVDAVNERRTVAKTRQGKEPLAPPDPDAPSSLHVRPTTLGWGSSIGYRLILKRFVDGIRRAYDITGGAS